MRGPGARTKYDVRRLWRCPQCGYERKVAAREVTVRCHCSKTEPLMKLVEPLRPQRQPAPELDLYMSESDFPAEPEMLEPLAGPGATPPLPSAMQHPEPAEELLSPDSTATAGDPSGEHNAEL